MKRDLKTVQTRSIQSTAVLFVVVIVGGAVATIAAASQVGLTRYAWFVAIAGSLLVAPFGSIRIPGIKASIVVGDTITFACAVLFGPGAAVLAAVVDGAIVSMRATRSPIKLLYNVATGAISMAASAFLAKSLFNDFGGGPSSLSLVYLVAALAVLTASNFLISAILIASYVATTTSHQLVEIWKKRFAWTVVSYAASGASALLAFYLASYIGYYVFLVLTGVMLGVFGFYKAYFGRQTAVSAIAFARAN